VICSDIIK